MTMIPPKIKKLPNLHKPLNGYTPKPQMASSNSNRSMPLLGSKMVR